MDEVSIEHCLRGRLSRCGWRWTLSLNDHRNKLWGPADSSLVGPGVGLVPALVCMTLAGILCKNRRRTYVDFVSILRDNYLFLK